MKSIFLCGPIASALMLAAAAQAADTASPMRDPMQPPSAAPASPRVVDTVAPTTEITPRHLMVVDGHRYLIAGGRRLGVGDLLGGARIERIDDGSVWLRDGGALRQLSLFGGVAKRVQRADESASSPATSPGNPSPIQKSTLPTGKRS